MSAPARADEFLSPRSSRVGHVKRFLRRKSAKLVLSRLMGRAVSARSIENHALDRCRRGAEDETIEQWLSPRSDLIIQSSPVRPWPSVFTRTRREVLHEESILFGAVTEEGETSAVAHPDPRRVKTTALKNPYFPGLLEIRCSAGPISGRTSERWF